MVSVVHDVADFFLCLGPRASLDFPIKGMLVACFSRGVVSCLVGVVCEWKPRLLGRGHDGAAVGGLATGKAKGVDGGEGRAHDAAHAWRGR